ncbi:hypothetical protein V2J09_017756 [Rumex salicifolius]
MDPNHPYNYPNSFDFSQNFLDLTGEQPNHPGSYWPNGEGYPYTSPSPNTPGLYGSGSAFHQWNSQSHVASLDDIQVSHPQNPNTETTLKKTTRQRNPSSKASSQTTPPKKTSRQGGDKRVKWSQGEELLLASAWVNTSTNIIVGNNQKAESYWDRVTEYYNTKRVEDDITWLQRSSTSIKSRWHNICSDTQKFVACHNHASNRRGSGENEIDVLRNAHTFFRSDWGIDFIWEHVWREIEHEPKWCAWLAREGGGSSKRSKLNASGFYSSSSNPDTPTTESGPESVNFPEASAPVRPIGIKNAKKKGKQAAHSSSESMEAHLEKVDRLTMLHASRDLQKKEAKKESLKAQKHIIDEYVRTQNEYVRTQKLQMLTQLLSFGELSPEQEMIKTELMNTLFPK